MAAATEVTAATGRYGGPPDRTHAMDVSSTAKHVHPEKGGAPQGRGESNADSACFGGRLPIRWVVPM